MSDLQTHYDETHEELAKANQRIAELIEEVKNKQLVRMAELEGENATQKMRILGLAAENQALKAENERLLAAIEYTLGAGPYISVLKLKTQLRAAIEAAMEGEL